MNLTRAQLRRLEKGDYSPLFFPYDPDVEGHGQPPEPPYKLVLDWDEGYRISDQFGNVTVVAPQPVRWIVVTSVKRENRGGWLVRFSTTDLRQHPEYLGPGGTYTTSRFRAIDDLEVVPRRDLEQMAKQAYDRDAAIRLERAIASRQQWRRTRNAARRESQQVFPAAA